MFEQRSRLVALPDGRKLEVVEAGDPKSPAVIVHNGTPQGAGFVQEHVEDAVIRGLRIVSYARPGYGKSTRHPGRNVASAAQDTAYLADALGIGAFATWGVSGGGPHALACAALLGDRVVAAACLAGVAPFNAEGLDFMAGMGRDNVEEFTAALKGEAALAEYLEPQVPALLNTDPETLAVHMESLLSAHDRAVLVGEIGRQIAALIQDGLKNGVYGMVDDDLAFVSPWGFSPSDIRRPLQIWQGEHDLMVPYSHGQWLADHIPGADVHLSPEDGHLTLVAHRIPQVHAWLASHS